MKQTKALSAETVFEVRDTCLCLHAQKAARRLARRFDSAFLPLGLTNGQFSLMVALSGPARLKMTELAALLAMDRTTLTAALKSLQRRRLVAILADADDGRSRRPELTQAGRALLAKATEIWRAEHAVLEASLTQIDPGQLRASLRAIG